MALSPGTRLGPYEVTVAIGAGGMGEVFRARDTKLDRDVAIKVLPSEVAQDRERLARFEREAKLLASLNHPNIAHVYGFESATLPDESTAHFLAMELVEGEDLAERLKSGAIPVDESLSIAKQIADGLEEAHEHGIIHRDLKPANIKVTPEGKVKVLDFGLAKALEGDPASQTNSQLSHSPTMSRHMTEAGMIMGTAAYMSPEQARGKPVDKRADIWAFGVVLFEMLTGERLFAGETVSDVLAAVLTRNPNLDALPSATPRPVRQLLRRCLDRDPRQRLRDVGDARFLLTQEEGDPGSGARPNPAQAPAPPGWRARAPLLIAAAALAIALFSAVSWRERPTASPFAVHFAVSAPDGRSTSEPVLSNDGSFVVYATDRLYVRDLSAFESRELPGTTGATQPFLSPDGKWVGFYADGKIKKVALAGGDPLVITDAVPNSPGASFVTNERILFSRTWNQARLMSVSADGGAVTAVSTLDAAAKERGHWWPRSLPDGRRVLFTIWYAAAGLSASQIAVLDLQTGTHRVLFPGAMAQYSDGHLLYYYAGQYRITPFDPSTLAVTGESRPVLAGALGLDRNGSSVDPISVSRDGTIAYTPGELDPVQTLTWIDRRSGQRTPTSLSFALLSGGSEDAVALSPDGRRIAASRPQDGVSHIWVYDLQGGEERLPGEGSNWGPVWDADGGRITYTGLRKGDFDIFTQTLGGVEEPVVVGDGDDQVLDSLPDGRLIIKQWLPDGTTSLLILSPGGAAPTPLVTGAYRSESGRVSPDGRWLAFCAAPSGRNYLYASAMSGRGGLQQVAAASPGDCGVRWLASPKELLFTREGSIVAVAYEDRGDRLVTLRESVVASVPAGTNLYGMTADGQRLLVGIRKSVQPAGRETRVMVGGIATLADASGANPEEGRRAK